MSRIKFHYHIIKRRIQQKIRKVRCKIRFHYKVKKNWNKFKLFCNVIQFWWETKHGFLATVKPTCLDRRNRRTLWYAWDERFEFDTEITGIYTPKKFIFSLIKAMVADSVCWNCNGDGMTGYYEPEACSTCEGFRFNWQEIPEPDWEAMAEGMKNI